MTDKDFKIALAMGCTRTRIFVVIIALINIFEIELFIDCLQDKLSI